VGFGGAMVDELFCVVWCDVNWIVVLCCVECLVEMVETVEIVEIDGEHEIDCTKDLEFAVR
jgi:hypothetical protein